MDYTPPPLFKQGTSAVARLVMLVAASLTLLIVDARFDALRTVRQVAATVLMPVERVVLIPRDILRTVFDYAQTSATLASENRDLKRRAVAQAEGSIRQAQLEAENAQLRKLLDLKQESATPLTAAEVLYDARDPYSQRIVIDRGSQHGLRAGYPVIDERGVVGQVTRVSPFQSEVTLLTDKDQAIPVQVVRNGLRSVAFGGARAGQLDLRFMAASADLQQGDLLVTSGLDGVYPPGLPVARIRTIERKADTAFSRVLCDPVAGVRSHRQLLVARYEADLPVRPAATDTPRDDRPGRAARAERAAAAEKAAAEKNGDKKAEKAPEKATGKTDKPGAAPATAKPGGKPATSPAPQAVPQAAAPIKEPKR